MLDLDAVHGMAPGADLVFWGAASGHGVDLREAMADMLDHHRADIVTNSYGSVTGEQGSPANIQAWNDLFVQAGVEGIGVYYSSGDEGDSIATLGYRSTIFPASSPYVTSVGGTSLGVSALDEYLFETGWGTTNSYLRRGEWKPALPGPFYYGGGGGTSRIFAEPWYQHGVAPGRLTGYWGANNRVVPDVATVGDPNTGLRIGITQTFPDGVRYGEYRLGGTSLSSPLFAGIMALADDRAGVAHGFANPALYAAAGSDAFHDVVDPRTRIAVVRTNLTNSVDTSDGKYWALRTMNQTGTLSTTQGYDDVTGVGTPTGEAFLDALSGP
jgi:subtilase family serine protease